MMEGPSEEREIQEYSSSNGSNSRVRWILDKGLNLGKKIVITGVVISSAPLILPPLAVISAIWFAFSVPYGLVFASYACTEKFMSKLLPGPESSLLLENGTLFNGGGGFGGDIMEEEENGQMEDVKRLDQYWQKGDKNNHPGNGEPVKYCGYEEVIGEYLETPPDAYGHQSTEKGDEEPRSDVVEIVKEEGYAKVVGEDLDGKDKRPLDGLDAIIEGIREEEKEEPVVKRSKLEQPVDDVQQVEVEVGKDGKTGDIITGGVVESGCAYNVNTCNEEEDLAEKTTGLLGKIRDEGNVGETGKEISETSKDVNQKNFALAAEMEKPSEVRTLKLGKFIGKMKGGKKRDKGSKENKEFRERRTEENVDVVLGMVEQVVYTGTIKELNRVEKIPEKVAVIEESIANISMPINGNKFVEVADRRRDGDKYSPTTEFKNSLACTSDRNAGSLKLQGSVEVFESKHAGIDMAMPASASK